MLRESYVKKTGEGLGLSLEGLDFSGISGYKGKKNGKALKERFFEWEYDGYRIAVCEEKDGEPELVVCRAMQIFNKKERDDGSRRNKDQRDDGRKDS